MQEMKELCVSVRRRIRLEHRKTVWCNTRHGEQAQDSVGVINWAEFACEYFVVDGNRHIRELEKCKTAGGLRPKRLGKSVACPMPPPALWQFAP